MKEIRYICDRYRKIIIGNPIKIIAESVDPETEDYTERIPENLQVIQDKHFCMACAEKVIATAVGVCEKKEFKDALLVQAGNISENPIISECVDEKKRIRLIEACLNHYRVKGLCEITSEQIASFFFRKQKNDAGSEKETV